MNIGRGMRRAREAAGLTLEQMAERVELPERRLLAAEAEGDGSTRAIVDMYAEALGMPAELIRLLGADAEDLRGITPEAAAKLGTYLGEVMAERTVAR